MIVRYAGRDKGGKNEWSGEGEVGEKTRAERDVVREVDVAR